MPNQTFQQIIEKTNTVITAFQKVEQRDWGIEGNMIELMKQVGELSKNVMMVEKYYLAERMDNPNYSTVSVEKIGDELSDILFMVIRIANHYQIDLEKAHMEALDRALDSLKGKGNI